MVKKLHHYGAKCTSREEWAKTVRDDREDFTAGSMTGRTVDPSKPTLHTYGDLPEPYLAWIKRERIDYVVCSYDTPIAWHDSVSGHWVVPDVNYSLTTTQHQATVRMAVDTWTGERWLHDYLTGAAVNLRVGKGKSPYGERGGW
jgi:hypothetical protein